MSYNFNLKSENIEDLEKRDVLNFLEEIRNNNTIFLYLKFCQHNYGIFKNIKKRKSDAIFNEILNCINHDQSLLLKVKESIPSFKSSFSCSKDGIFFSENFYAKGFEIQTKEFIKYVINPIVNENLKESYMLSNIVVLYGSSGTGKTHFLNQVHGSLSKFSINSIYLNAKSLNSIEKYSNNYNLIIVDNAENMFDNDYNDIVVDYFTKYTKILNSAVVDNLKRKKCFYVFSTNDKQTFDLFMNKFSLNYYIDFDVLTEKDVYDIVIDRLSNFQVGDIDIFAGSVFDFVVSRGIKRGDVVNVLKKYLNDRYIRDDFSTKIDLNEFLNFVYACSI